MDRRSFFQRLGLGAFAASVAGAFAHKKEAPRLSVDPDRLSVDPDHVLPEPLGISSPAVLFRVETYYPAAVNVRFYNSGSLRPFRIDYAAAAPARLRSAGHPILFVDATFLRPMFPVKASPLVPCDPEPGDMVLKLSSYPPEDYLRLSPQQLEVITAPLSPKDMMDYFTAVTGTALFFDTLRRGAAVSPPGS